jgi:hypothetical protein
VGLGGGAVGYQGALGGGGPHPTRTGLELGHIHIYINISDQSIISRFI